MSEFHVLFGVRLIKSLDFSGTCLVHSRGVRLVQACKASRHFKILTLSFRDQLLHCVIKILKAMIRYPKHFLNLIFSPWLDILDVFRRNCRTPQCPALSTTIPLRDLIPLIDHYDPNHSQNVLEVLLYRIIQESI